MGSSIALTLWAFLGMESAAQNSDAVENPKRDVPLACMFGTLFAAAIYILSTLVIQGIVPNPELAESNGPFALVYAKMFSPRRSARSSWRSRCWHASARSWAGGSPSP
jgi:putrescine:ornithine antiporter